MGKTNKTVKERINNHFGLYKRASSNSPLWMHETLHHCRLPPKDLDEFFDRFSLDILAQNTDYILNNVAEAEFISKLKPAINRREEVPEWDIDALAIRLEPQHSRDWD